MKKQLPERKSIRLKDYNYSENGYYFVTICTKIKDFAFGAIQDGKMQFSPCGLVVSENIQSIHQFYQEVTIDKFVIMPNHIHLIVCINQKNLIPIKNNDPTKELLSKVIQSFKASVTRQIRRNPGRNAYNAFPTLVWQSGYYDHIIRDEQGYQKIWQYIDTNPLKWDLDCLNTNSKR